MGQDQNQPNQLNMQLTETAETAAETETPVSPASPPRSTGSGDATGPANPLPVDMPDSLAETPTIPTPNRDSLQPVALTADERQKVIDSIQKTYRGLQSAAPSTTTETESELFAGSPEQCRQFCRANRFNEQLCSLRIVDYPGRPCRVFGVKRKP